MQTRSKARAQLPMQPNISPQPLNHIEEEQIPAPARVFRFTQFSRNFNHEVLKNLTYGIRIGPIKTGRVAISDRLSIHLKATYNLTGRFQGNQDRFLVDFQIIRRRAFPPNTFCVMQAFALRLANGRRIRYFNDQMQQNVSISAQKYIIFRFVKENIVL